MRISRLSLLLLAAACGGTGGDDQQPAIDASQQEPRPDADPNCAAWRLETVPVISARLMETLPVHPERSARIEVEVVHCPNDDFATPRVGFTLENEFLVIEPRVWRTGNDCDETETFRRPVVVKFLYPGQWTIQTTGDALVVDVMPAPEIACGGTTGSCQLDCDCAGRGEVCLSGSGFAGPISGCVRPCEFDRECLGVGTCLVNVADTIGNVCELGIAECDGTRTCPDGFDCQVGVCTPAFTLNAGTRVACTCDAECDSPLRCAFQGGVSDGRCEIVCPTASDGWCEGLHSCGAASVESAEAVCGFVGE